MSNVQWHDSDEHKDPPDPVADLEYLDALVMLERGVVDFGVMEGAGVSLVLDGLTLGWGDTATDALHDARMKNRLGLVPDAD